ncbi:MAG TPA: MFS transporter [Rhodobacteraceae bacterium]|jgi:MFS family permease|nr:MFS transporter [Paracoccaceae bacterium]
MSEQPTATSEPDLTDSGYAWWRLAVSLAISTVGGVGLWSVVVTLPAIEAEFGLDRGSASLPYTVTMIGFAFGGIIMGRLADRFGIFIPLVFGTVMLGIGYIVAAQAENMLTFALAQSLLIGMLGSAATFGPLVADVSLWFEKRRGLAVAVVASGNYLSGTIWPPILTHAIETIGWRQAHMGIGVICVVTMLPLAFLLRRRADTTEKPASAGGTRLSPPPANMSLRTIQILLIVAGLACCIAMSMPQVHIVAYCGDLGYGVARGAEMLSIMLGLGVVSRIASGFLADKIGGLGTLILGSMLQCMALLLYIPFDGLISLYVVSALFGLAQGGIVPSYAMIVRQYFPAREAGTRVSLVLMTTVVGMAIGGWMSGEIYDLTGSYQAAFMNGIAWNLLNMSIAFWLLIGTWRLKPA